MSLLALYLLVFAHSQPTTSEAPTSRTRCNAAPYRHLIGRTLGEVMNTRFPPNTRIYRIGDPPVIGEAGYNRLNIEINNRTRVRRVYCS
ncbi:MAG: hypothetical protein AAB680_03610 [Pseudomonadota bacterium]|mgnify:CR=1 FL=1